MGRLATHLAATAAFADNIPPPEKLPSVSLIDALLPRSWSRSGSSRKNPLDPNVRAPPPSIQTDIKRDKSGKMVMVRHRSKDGSVISGNEKITYKDVKKNKNGGDAKANGDNGASFTADEDAKLKELKGGGETWKNIAAEMNRDVEELKARWKEINGAAGQDGDQKNTGAGQGNKDCAQNDKQGGGGDFTDEQNAKIKELLATNTGVKNIAKELDCSNDKAFREHVNKLREEVGGNDNKNANNAKGQKDEKKDGDGLSKKDKEKIREMLEADIKTGYKKIADALNRAIDKPLKDEIGKIKGELEGGGDKKKDGGGDKKKDKGGNEGVKKDKEKSKKDEPKKPASIAPSHRSEPRFTMKEWRTLQEDEMFTFGELQMLTELVGKYGTDCWLKVASRFHDKTGRRVHPDDIRDKFDQMGKMGRR